MSVLTLAGEGYDDIVRPASLAERSGLTGRVLRFDTARKFGFISISAADGGGEVFFHIKEVDGGKAPREGDSVEFDTRLRGPDALRAVDVTRAGERARRNLAQIAAEGKAAGAKRTLSSLSEGFSASSAGRLKLEAVEALPAGLMSAADLKRRQADFDSVNASTAIGESPTEATSGSKKSQSSEESNRKAAQALKDQAAAAKEREAKERKRVAKKRTKQAAALSFSVDDEA